MCPAHFADDRTCIERIAPTCGKLDVRECTIVRIRNTMELSELEVSENLLGEIEGRSDIEVTGPAREIEFDAEGNLEPVRISAPAVA